MMRRFTITRTYPPDDGATFECVEYSDGRVAALVRTVNPDDGSGVCRYHSVRHCIDALGRNFGVISEPVWLDPAPDAQPDVCEWRYFDHGEYDQVGYRVQCNDDHQLSVPENNVCPFCAKPIRVIDMEGDKSNKAHGRVATEDETTAHFANIQRVIDTPETTKG